MIERLTAQVYRLVTSVYQQQVLAQMAGACRWVFNQAMELRERSYQQTGKAPSLAELCKALTGWRETHPWLKAGVAQVQQQALRDLDAAYQRWFSGQNERPRFRARHRWKPSLRFPDGPRILVERLSGGTGRIKLPKLGWLRFRWSGPLKGEVRSATVSQDAEGRWFVSVLCKVMVEEAPLREGSAIGVDLGVAQTASFSTGEHVDVPKMSVGDRRHLRRLQQRLARRTKGSKNWKKARLNLARYHRRLRDRRNDALHKLTHKLVEENQLVALEDLKVKAMTASAKGTAEKPGVNVRQKAGLNRSILEQGWGRFGQLLDYKARWANVTVLRVNPAFTSQQCSACGQVDAASRRTQASFVCTTCGHAENADVNAAKNILHRALQTNAPAEGHAAVGLGRGRQSVLARSKALARTATSMNQEPMGSHSDPSERWPGILAL